MRFTFTTWSGRDFWGLTKSAGIQNFSLKNNIFSQNRQKMVIRGFGIWSSGSRDLGREMIGLGTKFWRFSAKNPRVFETE